MKILMINVVCGIRSTGRICTDIAQVLESEGHKVRIAYGRGNVPNQYKKYAIRIGSEIDTDFHAIKSRLLDKSGFESKKSTMKFIKWVEEYDPDIIHLHNLHGYYINIEILFDYLKKSGKRIIWTLHDCWPFTGHCVYCKMDRCQKWKTGCDNCKALNEYPKAFYDNSKENWLKKKNIFNGLENMTLITPSKWLSNKVKESFLNIYDVQVINNGIDTNIFKHTLSTVKVKYNIDNKKVLLGVAAVWDDRKGLQDFLQLSTKITDDYIIVLIGLTKKQISKLPDNILGIKQTNNIKELVEWYSAAEFFLNPTYEDNYPTTNLESIACGTPVITYNTGGSPESASFYGKIVENISEIDFNSIEFDNTQKNDVNILSIQNMVGKYINVYNGNHI